LVLLVNTGSAQMSAKVLAAINQLANATVTPPAPNTCFGANCPGAWGWASPYMNAVISSPPPPKPVRYIINTSAAADHVGANEKIATSGFFPRGGNFGGAVESVGRAAAIIAHENVLNRMSAPAGKTAPAAAAAQPTDTYFDDLFKLSAYFNGEAVVMFHEPQAHTDGESIVFFRRSDVIAAGDVFTPESYPVIDVEKGGRSRSARRAEHILDLAVANIDRRGHVDHSQPRTYHTADVASCEYGDDDARPRAD
jgi:glyoxylase-like metal-dependent hydrolase (beta-lactamase superfamily II)